MLDVIIFTTGNIFGIVAPLDGLVKDCVIGTTSEVRSISREAASEEGSAVVRRLVEAVAGLDWAAEAVTNFLGALVLAASNHVRMGADAPLVVKDQVAGASVDGGLTSGAMQIFAA